MTNASSFEMAANNSLLTLTDDLDRLHLSKTPSVQKLMLDDDSIDDTEDYIGDRNDFWNMDLDDIASNPDRWIEEISPKPTRKKAPRDIIRQNMSCLDMPLVMEDTLPKKAPERRSVSMPTLPSALKSTRNQLSRKVSFGNVHVRVFERILDVNPACSIGPSISLGWKYKVKKTVDLDTWESTRYKAKSIFSTKKSTGPRHKQELLISQKHRKKLAKALGFSELEIAKNIIQVAESKRGRKKSLMALDLAYNRREAA